VPVYVGVYITNFFNENNTLGGNQMIRANMQLDAKGLACPMPVVKTKKSINDLEEGQVLVVQATDKGSKADLSAWASSVGHQYLGTVEEDDVLYHYIRKGSNEPEVEKNFEHTVSLDEIESRDGLVLDVREAAEYAFGHIEGAKSIPMGELVSRFAELDKEQEIFVICRTGKRSDLAAQLLANNGFTKVYNVLPGMNEWNGNITKDI
jgi:rhodanese-related sulfurtransferase/TusA-related sulfurtransferase